MASNENTTLYQSAYNAELSALESRYNDAVRSDDMETAASIVREYAALKGYGVDEYRDRHEAPRAVIKKGDFTDLDALRDLADESESVNVFALANGVSLVPDDFFSSRGARMYGYDTADGMESFLSIRSAMDSIRRQMDEYGVVRDMPKVAVYRAVPKGVVEGRLRSGGEWVSPSRRYAKVHGDHRFGNGGYRIIKETVSAENLWWDGNDINEWGFDDGESYSYRNTKNNRKLLDAVTYDAKGKPVPLSKRFNEDRSQVFYQSAYHGSPFSFSKFTLDHIGNGEGHQAHGWGLYFTQDSKVAERYRKRLSSVRTVYKVGRNVYRLDSDSRYVWRDGKGNEAPEHVMFALRKLRMADGNVGDAVSRLMADSEDWGRSKDKETRRVGRQFRKAAQWLGGNTVEVQRESGQLYEVDIPENDVLLDEDKLLSEQPVAVRQAVYDWYASRPDFYNLPKDIDDLPAHRGERFYKDVVLQMGREGADDPQRAASLELNRLGIKGITYDGNSDGRCFVVFDDNAITVLDTFYQNRNAEKNRGAFHIGPNRTFRIELMANADFSTFVHESSHFQLEMLADMVSEPDASGYIKQEWQVICDYLGGDIRTLSGQARIDAHERFARSFEAYLMEGKAPSVELRTVFRRFKDWLVHIYRTVRNLDVRLSDDIRRVFDRMLASDAQIEQAAIESGIRDSLVTAQNLGMSEDETRALKRLYDRELAEADDRLRKRLMRSEVRKAKKQYREELKRAQKQAEKEYEESNLVYVGRLLTDQDDRTLALNEAELVNAYGKDYLTKLPKFDGKNIYAKEGETFLDELAEANGFGSSDELLQALENIPPKKQWVAQRSQEIVDTFFGDTVNAAEISDAVDEAMNNDPKGKRLKAELVLLRKAVKSVEGQGVMQLIWHCQPSVLVPSAPFLWCRPTSFP